MTLYEFIKMYGTGSGEETMWKTIESISNAVEHSMTDEEKNAMFRDLYGDIVGHHYNQEMADEDIKKMYYVDRAGNKHNAPYWPKEAVREIYNSIKNEIKPYTACDFEVAMNLMASNNWPILEKWFPGMNERDRNERTVDLAVNFLKDPDANNPETIIWDYMKK